ncbi:MAG: sugar phosphate nucleotidyltransferase [Eubacteriales bacterium]|nr:sugar phosphate nucleotidyltransferase [Eubacteriales bacterium]
MKGPILLIMAAGMGSRYGGLKQMDPVGAHGEFILDYSLYDAKLAGFERAVVVIKRENEKDFHELLGKRAKLPISYVYQELTDLPAGCAVPEGRQKPWGTGHAVLAARDVIDAPFCVINADDYYGREAFQLCADHLRAIKDDGDLSMVGYLLKNTLSETGSVARGVCAVDEKHELTDIHERTHIISTVDGPMMTEDMENYVRLSPETIVSMNMWGFPCAMMDAFRQAFPAFLSSMPNPLKSEFFVPSVVDELLNAGKARVHVDTTADRWYGVTYREDKPLVDEAIARMTANGQYPSPLWGE